MIPCAEVQVTDEFLPRFALDMRIGSQIDENLFVRSFGGIKAGMVFNTLPEISIKVVPDEWLSNSGLFSLRK